MDERPDVPLTESEAERNSRTFRISQVREATDHAGYEDEVTLEILLQSSWKNVLFLSLLPSPS